jgi:protein arginine kinase
MAEGNGHTGPAMSYDAVPEWLRGGGEGGDIVLSSRVRVARNIVGFPFMSRATETDRTQVLDLCRKQIAGVGDRMLFLDLHSAERFERTLLTERQLISRPHALGKAGCPGRGGAEVPRGVAIGLPDERVAIMVNEEDHLRMQVITAGLALERTLADVDAIDDRLEEGLIYAFSPRFGYQTACPTNVGTGVRFGVMLHLPALRMSGQLEKVRRAAGDMSLAVRGFFGEGSEALGDLYQLSNQTTLGKSEQILLHELGTEILPAVLEYERTERRKLMDRRRNTLEDAVGRAIGVMRHARLLTTEEAMQNLSMIRLGLVLGVVGGVPERDVNHLMLVCQPGHLQHTLGREMNQADRRVGRADLMRERFAGLDLVT